MFTAAVTAVLVAAWGNSATHLGAAYLLSKNHLKVNPHAQMGFQVYISAKLCFLKKKVSFHVYELIWLF